jgi:chromate transporter
MGALREVSLLFLKLGCTAFGGPAVHIAMMRREVVERRRWLTDRQFLDLLGATHLIPGPNSTEMAIHLGFLRAGWPGLLAAGGFFIAPPMLMVLGAAWAYVRFGGLPQLGWLLYGVKPVVVALVAQALWNLGGKGLARPKEMLIGAAALAAYFLGLNEIAILAAGALIGWAICGGDARPPEAGAADRTKTAGPGGAGSGEGGGPGTPEGPARRGLAGAALAIPVPAAGALAAPLIFLKFLKIGSVLYGSGYVLLPFLRAAFVAGGGPLSETQLLDAVAVGQVTPGPFFTTATFIGYLLGGVTGGLLATLGIFLPAFAFVAATNPWIPRLRDSRALARVLDGVNAASLGLMGGAAWQLGRAALVDGPTAALAAGALILSARKVSSTWIIAAGGLIGLALRWMAG